MYDNLTSSILKEGIIGLNKTISDESCRTIREFIDDYDPKKSEINYGGSEKRIWNAEKICPEITEFARFSNEIVSAAKRRNMKCYSILAYQNTPCDINKYGLGRWHCDSMRSQMKVFNFLKPVGLENGPLEILSKTHSFFFKALGLLSGRYISPSDFFLKNTDRKYQRVDEKYINLIKKFGVESRKMTTKNSGESFLVDSSALHRASPLQEGNRYALCAYFRNT